MNWKPINTAPRDGTHICIAEMRGGRWIMVEDYWRKYCDGFGEGFGHVMKPTHWTKLPYGPEDLKKIFSDADQASAEVSRMTDLERDDLEKSARRRMASPSLRFLDTGRDEE